MCYSLRVTSPVSLEFPGPEPNSHGSRSASKPIDPRPAPGSSCPRGDGSYAIVWWCTRCIMRMKVQQKNADITTTTSKRSKMIPLCPPKGEPYNTLLRFRHPFQGTEPRSRPVRVAEVTLVHLRGPRSNSCPTRNRRHFLHKVNGEHLPLRVSSTSL